MAEEEVKGVRPEREITASVPAPRRQSEFKLPAEEVVAARGVPPEWAVGVLCPTCGGRLIAHGDAHYSCPRHGMMEAVSVRRV